MSDTPRTNSETYPGEHEERGVFEAVDADFARTLERENAALREALRGLVEACPCQNGCAPNDMTCATRKAEAALAGTPSPVKVHESDAGAGDKCPDGLGCEFPWECARASRCQRSGVCRDPQLHAAGTL